MQTKVQKEHLIQAVAQQAALSKAIVFANFKGLTVKDVSALKRELRTTGATLQVLKKTLLNIALEKAGVAVNARLLEGQVAVVFSPDEVSAAKTIAAFAKKYKDFQIIVGGALGPKALSAAEVKELALLPTLHQLRAKLAGTLQAPIGCFVRALAGNITGFVRVLQVVAERK